MVKESKICKNCWKRFYRDIYTNDWQWKVKEYCDRVCSGIYNTKRHIELNKEKRRLLDEIKYKRSEEDLGERDMVR
jgi:hypothetical protein